MMRSVRRTERESPGTLIQLIHQQHLTETSRPLRCVQLKE